jgi:predicted nucleic acid-binding protein
MPDRIFLDTNILLYAKIDDGSEKHTVCRRLLTATIVGSEIVVSTQVLNEYYVNARKKNIPPVEIQNNIFQFISDFEVIPLTKELIPETFHILNRFKFSYWDSSIVSAALEGNCGVLYTEDLQDGQIINNSLRIINPVLPDHAQHD